MANRFEFELSRKGFEKAQTERDPLSGWVETRDFPLTDPWSVHTRSVISRVRAERGFKGNFLEAGVGDGRNIATAGVLAQHNEVTGIDIDEWRLELAKENLLKSGINGSKLNLIQGDAVGYLHKSKDEIRGWGIACLPQAPGVETVNHADGFDADLPSLKRVKGLELDGLPVDSVGLTLNAAFLDALRPRVNSENFNLLLTLSDRIPLSLRRELFAKTGWEVIEKFGTKEPVQQDPDTGISYVAKIDDGSRFYQKLSKGVYSPISATEAETRRKESLQNGGRDNLNVHHHLDVFLVKPSAIQVYVNK